MRAATKKSPKNATPKKAARSPFTRKAMLECMREILSRGTSQAVWKELKGHASADRETVLSLYKRSVYRRLEWGGFGPLSAVADGGDYPMVIFRAGPRVKGEIVGHVVGPCFALHAHQGDDLVQLVADAAGVKLVDDAPKTAATNPMDADPLFQELADENAGIVAPTPVPLWKPRPDHPGTTLPPDWQHPNRPELKGWNWYPVVQHDVEPAHVIRISERCWAHVEVCQQDGCWVEGVDYTMRTGGGGYAPGRTGGEHPSALHAELYGWERVKASIGGHTQSTREHKESVKLANAVQHRIMELRVKLKATTAPTATGLQLQIPSTAPLPEDYAKAKDLKPGMVVLPPRRKEPHTVKGVELYGKSCSLMFEGNRPGMVVNPLQPVKLVQVQHVAMAADALPETVAAVREVIGKAYAHKPGKKARTPKRKLGHQAGDVLPDGTLVVDPTNAILELHDAANGVHVQFTQPVPLDQLSASFVVPVDAAHNAKLKLNVATPPATAPTPEQSAPYALDHVVGIMERHKNAACGAGETWAAFDARCEALLSEAVASLDELYSNGYKSSALAIHKHVLDVYGHWLPTQFAPQAPTPEKSAPVRFADVREMPPVSKPAQMSPHFSVPHTLTELAAPFGNDRREREVVKKRFRSMYGKLSTWPADQRRAFIDYITNTLDQ